MDLRIVSGPAFELIAELAAFGSGPARPSLESGKTWIREVRALAGADLIGRVEQWAIPMYAELAPIALEAGPPFSIDALVARLRTLPAADVRRRLVGAESLPNRAMVSDGAIDRALAGDRPAQAEVGQALSVNPPARRSLDRLLSTSAGEVQGSVVAIVEEWAARVFPAFEDAALGLVRHDVEQKERHFGATPWREALRAATNGVEFDDLSWATDVVVIPTVALRPFIAPVESGTTSILIVSVADEAFDQDPTAPPRRLVQVATALGDELRLRILHLLANGEFSAKEIADMLGVDRTSLHHHLGILRSAGLVTARAEGLQSWRYAIRAEGVAGAGAALTEYLGGAPR